MKFLMEFEHQEDIGLMTQRNKRMKRRFHGQGDTRAKNSRESKFCEFDATCAKTKSHFRPLLIISRHAAGGLA
jgi:hypothetical protein